MRDPISKITKEKGAGGVAQVEKRLSSKREALSTTKKKKVC
jgi:hypothetical protein